MRRFIVVASSGGITATDSAWLSLHTKLSALGISAELFVCGSKLVNEMHRLAAVVRRQSAESGAAGAVYVVLSLDSNDAQWRASTLLEGLGVPVIGNRPLLYSFDAEDLVMTGCYSGVHVPPFAVVDSSRPSDMHRLDDLNLPVELIPVEEWPRTTDAGTDAASAPAALVVHDRTALGRSIQELLALHPRVFAFEAPSLGARHATIRLLVAAQGPNRPLWWLSTLSPAGTTSLSAALSDAAQRLSSSVLVHSGTLEAVFRLSEDGHQLQLQSLRVGFALWDTAVLDAPAESFATLVDLLTQNATERLDAQRPNYVVVFDAKMKGYYLRAARDLKKGDVVFPDEGRTFAMVTKAHVVDTWSEEDKVTFTRYAWPLDSDGHVYAIWEEHPKRWRPINHSCNPSCINAAPHSLNVIAARDICAGEDLTMDYAAFCDYTMKPFQCHCGTGVCRGWIQPDTASLAKYQQNAWHRKQPDPAGGIELSEAK